MASVGAITNSCADDDGHVDGTSGHVMQVRRLKHNLAHASWQELAEADFDNWTLANHCRTDCCAHHGRFGNRCFAYATGSELFNQSPTSTHDASHLPDILSHQEDSLVGAELVAHALNECFGETQARHGSLLSPRSADIPSDTSANTWLAPISSIPASGHAFATVTAESTAWRTSSHIESTS